MSEQEKQTQINPLTDGVLLQKPLEIGQKSYTRIILQVLDAGAAMDATADGEKVRFVKSMPIVVESPTLITAHRIRRQIRRLETNDGETLQGPLPYEDLRRLSEPDYLTLVALTDQLDTFRIEKELDNKPGRDTADAGAGSDGVGV